MGFVVYKLFHILIVLRFFDERFNVIVVEVMGNLGDNRLRCLTAVTRHINLVNPSKWI